VIFDLAKPAGSEISAAAMAAAMGGNVRVADEKPEPARRGEGALSAEAEPLSEAPEPPPRKEMRR
jgi:uncharacterized protein (DUF849 family)